MPGISMPAVLRLALRCCIASKHASWVCPASTRCWPVHAGPVLHLLAWLAWPLRRRAAVHRHWATTSLQQREGDARVSGKRVSGKPTYVRCRAEQDRQERSAPACRAFCLTPAA